MDQPPLRPLRLGSSLLAFGLPAILEYLVAWRILPLLDRLGVALTVQFAVLAAPLVLLLAAALVAYRLEGRAWTWPAFRDRLRLGRLGRRGWAWAGGLAVVNVGLYLGAAYAVGALFPEASFPAAVGKVLGDGETFLGYPLQGAWWLLGAWMLFYFVNVVGEELWWRGILLPRQELAHGRWTWVVHGVLWAGFHIGFYPTDFFVLLPGALAFGWVCQRQKSTVPGLLAHAVLNALASMRLVAGILG